MFFDKMSFFTKRAFSTDNFNREFSTEILFITRSVSHAGKRGRRRFGIEVFDGLVSHAGGVWQL